ncbi:hypothetical protein [Bacillus pseudomycoides]|uniref:hypothetical protein n=1 Tax=Bacillus pseudomycoides TaxID=64104 RepID=UPI000BF8E285|nr:hypothetical protein [Bacillus pseudomycoides]PEP86082.1 hypothetical protein CN584_08470 [Bacillus pseudomycoides]PHE19194.1 hypothetical protein COF59_08170 [Bacillus pseudomycoides]
MELTLDGLEECFNDAVNTETNFVAVKIEMDGFPSDELIINDKHNIALKLEYYKKTYNEDLEHRYAPGIRIVGYAYGHSLSGIQRELGLLM